MLEARLDPKDLARGLKRYRVDAIDVEKLGGDTRPDAYSLWCAETDATEMPAGWTPD